MQIPISVSFEISLSSIISNETKAHEIHKLGTRVSICPQNTPIQTVAQRNHLIFIFLIHAVEFSAAPEVKVPA